jgi:hypothetical protein
MVAIRAVPQEGRMVDSGHREPELVSLTLPCEERFIVVARIVVGGLAARLDLSFQDLDDLQLAAEAVLAERSCVGEEVTIELMVIDRRIVMSIGPLSHELIQQALDGKGPDAEQGETVDLGVLLAAVVDDLGVDQRDDGEWLRLGKRVATLPRT